MKRIHIILVIILVNGALWGQSVDAGMSPEEASDLFSQAKRLFSEANELAAKDPEAARTLYVQSVLHFERLVEDGGTRNGRLFYNIGNVYVRLGDMGRAILNYRRSMLYRPNDENLIRNLEFARTQRADSIEASESDAIARTLLFWHFDFSSRTRFIFFVGSFLLVWVLGALRLLMRGSGLIPGAIIAGIVAALMLGSLVWESAGETASRAAVIVAPDVVGRKGNGETYQPSFVDPLHAGTEIELREARGEWSLVALVDGSQTWLPSDSIELVLRRD